MTTARNFAESFAPFTPTVIERQVAGESCQFYLGNVVGKRWYGRPADACEEMRFIRGNLVKPGSVVLECGAHHGAHTILLSKWVGDQGKVIAVEPMPENAAIIRRNIELNGLTNVTLVEKMVGAHSARHTMVHKSNATVTNKSRGNTIEIDGTTIDALAREFGTPSLITVDVEGFEYQVLEGGRTTLATNPALCVEVHTVRLSHYGKTFTDIWNVIDPSRYDLFIQKDDDQAPVASSHDSVPKDRVLLFFRPR